jgi:hypothetical protein
MPRRRREEFSDFLAENQSWIMYVTLKETFLMGMVLLSKLVSKMISTAGFRIPSILRRNLCRTDLKVTASFHRIVMIGWNGVRGNRSLRCRAVFAFATCFSHDLSNDDSSHKSACHQPIHHHHPSKVVFGRLDLFRSFILQPSLDLRKLLHS